MIEINLLPIREEKRKADLRQLAVLLAASLVGAVLMSGVVHMKLSNDLSAAQAGISETQRQIDQYKPQLEQVERYRATKQAIEEKLAVIERLDRARSGPVHILDELSIHAPERLWVTGIEASGGRITVKGMSLDNELVALFMTALSDSPYFDDVELEETEAKDVDGLRLNAFELSSATVTPGLPEESVTTSSPGAIPGSAGL
jgi:type IV pilus assembly protein PilN